MAWVGVLMTAAAVVANVPGILDGNPASIAAGVLCGLCFLFVFICAMVGMLLR